MKKTLNIHYSLILLIFLSLVAFLAITASANYEPPDPVWLVTSAAQARTNAGDCADRPGEVCKELCMHDYNRPGQMNFIGYFECQPQ